MRLDPRALGLAGATVAGVVVLLCALIVMLTPADGTFGGMTMHRGMAGMGGMSGMTGMSDTSGMGHAIGWGGVLLWLAVWIVATGLAFAAVAALYNRFLDGASGGRV